MHRHHQSLVRQRSIHDEGRRRFALGLIREPDRRSRRRRVGERGRQGSPLRDLSRWFDKDPVGYFWKRWRDSENLDHLSRSRTSRSPLDAYRHVLGRRGRACGLCSNRRFLRLTPWTSGTVRECTLLKPGRQIAELFHPHAVSQGRQNYRHQRGRMGPHVFL